MDHLNPSWLRIELDAIDAETERWSEALRESYESSVRQITISSATVNYGPDLIIDSFETSFQLPR